MNEMPTYEELVRPGDAAGGGFAQKLRDLPPGGVIEVPLMNGRSVQQAQNSVSNTVARLRKEGHAGLRSRTRDGRLFMIRLRDEDMR